MYYCEVNEENIIIAAHTSNIVEGLVALELDGEFRVGNVYIGVDKVEQIKETSGISTVDANGEEENQEVEILTYKFAPASVEEREQYMAKLREQSKPDIEALRAAAIAQTKAWVDKTLAVGMTYADGKTYNITREKRADLAGVILVGKMNEEQSVTDEQNILRWNVSGEVHEDWLYKDLCALAYTMYMYVTPIIEKQQHAEIKINAAVTVDEINAVVHGLIGGDSA